MPAPERSGPVLDERWSRAIRVAALGATALLGLLFFAQCFHRYLVNDDYFWLHVTWLRSSGSPQVPGVDWKPVSFTLLYVPFEVALRVFGAGYGALVACRLLILAGLAAVAALAAAHASRTFGTLAALLTPVAFLSSAVVVHRGLDVRPDVFTTVLWLVLLRVQTSPRAGEPRSFFFAGVLLGLGILNRFKSLVVLPVSGILLLLALRGQPPRRWLAAAGIVAAGVSGALLLYVPLYGVSRLATDLAGTFELMTDLGRIEGALGGSLRIRAMISSVLADAPFWVFAGIGLARSIVERRVASIPLVALAFLSVAANPGYHEYNLVQLFGLLAPFAGHGLALPIEALAARSSSRPLPALIAGSIVLTALAPQLGTLARSARVSTLGHQLSLERFIRERTSPGATVFSLDGIGLTRGSIFHWYMPAILSGPYRTGTWRFADELRRAPPELVVESYRVPIWLVEEDQRWLEERYVPLAPWILVPGTAPGRGATRDAELPAGFYEALSEDGSAVLVAGREVAAGSVFELPGGIQRVQCPSAARCAVRRFHPPEARALVANPERKPYLVPPGILAWEDLVKDAAPRLAPGETPW